MRYSLPRAQVLADAAEQREVVNLKLMAIAVRSAHHLDGKEFTKYLKQMDLGD